MSKTSKKSLGHHHPALFEIDNSDVMGVGEIDHNNARYLLVSAIVNHRKTNPSKLSNLWLHLQLIGHLPQH